jgi:hypothetical protein
MTVVTEVQLDLLRGVRTDTMRRVRDWLGVRDIATL